MKKSDSHPPKWANQFLKWFCDEAILEEVQGDLHEAYHHRARQMGTRKATWLFIKDVLLFFKPYSFEKYSNTKQFIPMLNNYFKIAIRNILHRKGFTAINLVGLAFGITAVISIGIYVQNELTYDFHTPHHERVYRLMNQYRDQTYTPMFFEDYYQSSPETQLKLVNYLRNRDEVESACHFVLSHSAIGGGDDYFAEIDEHTFLVKDVLYTNTGKAFQKIFPQSFIQGSAEHAFSTYNRMVLTERIALNWFGNGWRKQRIIGKKVVIEDEQFELSGVIENIPNNAHFDFDILIYQDRIPSWAGYTYFRTTPNASVESLIAGLNRDADLLYPGYSEDVLQKGIIYTPLANIHFTDGTLYELKPVANKVYIGLFCLAGVVILLLILTNYTNLSIAMYADRQKELGVRKVLGARKEDISSQLLVEAIVLSLMCFPICLLFLSLILPSFFTLMGLTYDYSVLFNAQILLVLVGILFLIGFLSGFYPAFIYARRSMLHLFGKVQVATKFKRRLSLRNVLLAVQFVMIIGLLGLTTFVYQQMKFVSSTDLGYEKDGVVYFGIDGVEKYQALKNRLETMPEIEAVGANGIPGADMFNQMTYKMKGTDVTFSDGTEQYLDIGTLNALGIECKACNQFKEGKDQLFIINQTAAEKLAKIKQVAPADLIGETLIAEPEWENEEFGQGIHYTIDGIIDDYKYFSMKYDYQPMLINVLTETDWAESVVVKANTQDWRKTMQEIEYAYYEVEQARPFSFTFLDDRIHQLYEAENRFVTLIGSITIVSILLALMGLAGIVSYLVLRKQKEIGIRKVLGASVLDILLNVNKQFLILVGIATLLATPLAIYFAENWLSSFAFRITPHPVSVIIIGLLISCLVMVLVSLNSMKVANKKPAEVLRAE